MALLSAHMSGDLCCACACACIVLPCLCGPLFALCTFGSMLCRMWGALLCRGPLSHRLGRVLKQNVVFPRVRRRECKEEDWTKEGACVCADKVSDAVHWCGRITHQHKH
eukprot:3310567-Rhodomonas_salina.2